MQHTLALRPTANKLAGTLDAQSLLFQLIYLSPTIAPKPSTRRHLKLKSHISETHLGS